MKINYLSALALIVSVFFMASCNLTKDVEIELPEYDRQPVVECYLEPGKPFRLLLTQSFYFFDQFNFDSNFVSQTLLDSAQVSITYDNNTVNLRNQLSADFSPLKIFNYTSDDIVPVTPGTVYNLNIRLADGRNIAGQTSMMTKVPIDSIVVQWSPNADTLARALTYITDDLNQVNFYRRLLNYSSLDSFPAQDFLVRDRISQEKSIAFGTGYDFVEGDTIFNTIFHIDQPYFDYKESILNAISGSLNPFAQPSQIKSNVSGSANPLGIFTSLVYDRKMTIVRK